MRAEGFSCSLCVLYGGLGITKLQFLINKINKKNSSMGIKSWIKLDQDPDPYPHPDQQLRKMLNPDPH